MNMVFDPKPTTPPPDANKPYLPLKGEDGKTQWVLLHTDAADGITDEDFEFAHGDH